MRLAVLVAAAVLIKSASSGPVTTTRKASTTTKRAVALSRPIHVGRLNQPALEESSGLVASRKYPGIFWSINDSGHKPELFAVDATNLEVELPRNGDLVDIQDINGDDRSDLVIRYYATDGDDAAHTVRLLITK